MDYIRLGQHLKSSRETKGYTQKYIADVLKVTPQTISTWETGKNKIDIDTLEKLCSIYGISIIDALSFLELEKPTITADSELSEIKRAIVDKVKTMDDTQVAALNSLVDSILALQNK